MQNPTIVIGASRGIGAATVDALVEAGNNVIAIARNAGDLEQRHTNPAVTTQVGDGRDRSLADQLIETWRPAAVVVGGGADPKMAPLEDHTFDTLSVHWNHDVAIAFTWLQAALANPIDELNDVIVISSGAGIFGSPGSGGYAGAKATTRFITAAASDSATRRGLPTRFTTVNPKITTDTRIGKIAADGYALVNQPDVETVSTPAPLYSAADAGKHIANLINHPPESHVPHYLLAEAGLQPL